MAEETAKTTASSSAKNTTVVMRGNVKGFQRGQEVKVSAETAEFLVANKHADKK